MATHRDDLLLEGEFLLLSKKKGVHHVTLTRSCIFFHLNSNNSTTYEEKCMHITDIVGCHCLEQSGSDKSNESSPSGHVDVDDHLTGSTDFKNGEVTKSPSRSFPRATDASASGFVIFAYPFRKKLFSSKKVRTREVLAFEVLSSTKTVDERRKVAETWRNVINCLCRDLPVSFNDIPHCVPPPKGKLLLLINPFSGPGKAYTIFKNEIAPMLNEACVPYKALITEHAGHAGELMKTIDLSDWYGVVIVSGDGLVFETINGIMQRDNWATSILFPIGCLPAGSGNALCCSINYAAGEPVDTSLVLHSTFVLVKHRVVPMDLVVVHIPDRTIFSFLSVTWGIVADIDFESEKYRKLGEARFTVGAIKRIIGLRSYRGRVSFLPVAEYTPKVTATSSKVLSKIRRFSLQSGSGSKSTLNSVDSKSSNSSQLSNSKNNIGHCKPELHLAEGGTGDSLDKVESKIEVETSCCADNNINGDGSRPEISNNRNQGDNVSQSVLIKNGNGINSVGQENSEDISQDFNHDGSGDAKSVNTADLAGSNDMESQNSAFQYIPDSESPSSTKLQNSCLLVSHTEDVDNNSGLAQNTLVTESNEYCSTSQGLNSQAHSSSGHVINGCSIERDRSITILSGTKEIKVEQETYHVKKADFVPVPTPLLSPLNQDVPSNWVTLDESFILAIAVYQTHLGSDMLAAPDAHLCDGYIHLMMVREGIPRNALLNLFLTFHQGKHICSPYVDVVKVLAFRFEPASKDGNIMVDGERFDPTPIQGQILPGLARVMAIQ